MFRPAYRTVSPDGREWEIWRHRVERPKVREFDVDLDGDDPLAALVAPFVYVVTLLAALGLALVAWPLAVARSLFSRRRTVEAVCYWPAELRIVWRTDAAHVRAVARQVALGLQEGYGNLSPDHAVRVSMTEPPGFRDLDA